jgi:hypothetical protein
MARGSRNADVLDEVEAPEVEETETDEVEEVQEQAQEEAPKAKAKKEPARGDLPEGYVTPVSLAHVLTEQKLHTNRGGEIVEVKPQMVYSYIKNSKDFAAAFETVTDSIGKERVATTVEKGVEAWKALKTRAQERSANAAAKKEAKAKRDAEKAAAKEAEGETTEAEGGEEQVTEAE